MDADHITHGTQPALRRTLLELARFEDDCAAAEAAAVPYWSPCPASVAAHRLAAQALRGAADRFLVPKPAEG